MESKREVPCVPLKIAVGRENCESKPVSGGADEKVDRRSGDPFGPALVEEPRRLLIINGCQGQVSEDRKTLAHLFEIMGTTDAGKDLLPDRPDQLDLTCPDKIRPFLHKVSFVDAQRS